MLGEEEVRETIVKHILGLSICAIKREMSDPWLPHASS